MSATANLTLKGMEFEMALKFAILSAIEIAAVVLLLLGLWHEGKLIAFEERIENAIARRIARVIIARRRKAIDRAGETEKVR